MINPRPLAGSEILAEVQPDGSHLLKLPIPKMGLLERWGAAAFLSFWLCGWAGGEIFATYALFSTWTKETPKAVRVVEQTAKTGAPPRPVNAQRAISNPQVADPDALEAETNHPASKGGGKTPPEAATQEKESGGFPWAVRVFLLAWLGGWTVGGCAAMREWYRLVRGPRQPQVIFHGRTLEVHNAPGREKIEMVERSEAAEARIDWAGDRQRLIVDQGTKRIEIAPSLSEPEREWLFALIRAWSGGA